MSDLRSSQHGATKTALEAEEEQKNSQTKSNTLVETSVVPGPETVWPQHHRPLS